MSNLDLHFLGPVRFWHNGQPVDAPPAKATALLAYLAVTRTPQTRDTILALLWPESGADAARKNLRNILWAIRKGLGDDVLQTAEERLRLLDAAAVDVWVVESAATEGQAAGADPAARFRHLEDAAAAYGGLLLDGMAFADAPDFDFWLTAARERLEQVHLRTLAALIEGYRAAGDWPAVTATAERALAHDNLQEPMHRALMEAHARVNERPEALRQYDTLRTTLDRELGVEPLPETEALRVAIVAGALQPMAPPGVAVAPGARRRPAGGEPPRVPFVGRAAERSILDAQLSAAAVGKACVVLLTGEVGIGKSRLWQEWAAGLPAGVPVLATRCLDAMQGLPFAPLTALFGGAQQIGRLLSPTCGVSPVWLAEMARLLPELRARRPDLPVPPVLPPDEERRRIFEALVQCLLAIDGRPLVFHIDDVHWADQATLDWLGYLVHRLRETPLLLVAAYRPADAPAALVQLVAGWAREGVAHRLPLERLTQDEAEALLRALGGDPALAGRVQAQSAGNPYFLIELAHAEPGDVPPALAELVQARLERLPETARQVLQAAAVLEPDFDFATLRRTAGRGEEETLDALDALLGTNVLVERNGGRYEFSHP
ncbi:MAG TPA: BTAD domain-containing putative transcriptional regulator, partial [Chloroflexia bacterium]|nr:BTAD domain-containing putative transcriptional regulator [Chloroflexia bacterium]